MSDPTALSIEEKRAALARAEGCPLLWRLRSWAAARRLVLDEKLMQNLCFALAALSLLDEWAAAGPVSDADRLARQAFELVMAMAAGLLLGEPIPDGAPGEDPRAAFERFLNS